jgi:hypothetical protein
MPRLALSFVAVLVALAAPAASAEAPPLTTRTQLSFAVNPEEQVCAGVLAPQPWRDASDALFFASGPTARLDEHELWASAIAPLVAVRYVTGTLRLVLLGAPTSTQIRFTALGWRPRWPFC